MLFYKEIKYVENRINQWSVILLDLILIKGMTGKFAPLVAMVTEVK